MNSFLRFSILFIFIFVTAAVTTTTAFAQRTVFTAQELAKYNGKDGAKAYTAYEGVVYDVSNSSLWKMGEHFGLQAGIDLTDKMKDAPHGAEVFAGFTEVGVLEGYSSAGEDSEDVSESERASEQATVYSVNAAAADSAPATEPWYSSRLRWAGISMLGWSGIILGVFFVLTFATCFAMPWAQMRLPWTGARPGADPLDVTGVHRPWTAVHKHFVWFTVLLGVIHGVLGVLQLFGIYL